MLDFCDTEILDLIDCRLFHVLRYIGMTPITLSTCIILMKSGAIDKHMREEHNMLLQVLRSYLMYTFYFYL